MEKWTRERVVEAVKRGESLSHQDLSNLDLQDVNLWGVNLRRANLQGANLQGANLRRANLWGANLQGVSLQHASLQGVNLRHANLRHANLRCAELWDADMWCVNLWGANLRHANLRDANLANTHGGIMSITGLRSGYAYIVPTPDGWRVRVGCWTGTVKELRRMIESDSWVASDEEQREVRRPAMLALCDLFDAHKKQHKGVVKNLRIKWGDEKR